MSKRTIVVAYSLNKVIGNDNKLLWKQSADLKRFKEITQGNTVIMGRKTFESIGKPLPNRRNIVISTNFQHDGVETMSLDEAKNLQEDLFIIGGGQIYRELLNDSHEILATLIHDKFEGDTSFPEIDDKWMLVEGKYHRSDDKNQFGYSFLRYVNRFRRGYSNNPRIGSKY
jgi:dihydrofolate reductase